MSDQVSIMIVEDDEADMYLLRRTLNKTGKAKSILEANNGKEAITVFENFEASLAEYPDGFPPQIIFLDINMPIMDGFEFIEAFSKILEQDSRLQSTVCVLFTSSDNQSDIDRAMGNECVGGYLTKGNAGADEISSMIDRLVA